jgi:TonB family protein
VTHYSKPFSAYLSRSAGLHAACLLALIAFSVVAVQQVSDLKNKNLRLIEASVRVDMVAMPKFTIKELEALEAENTPPPGAAALPEQVAATPEPESKIVLEKEKKSENFADMLKRLGDQKVSKPKEKSKKDADGLGDGERKELGKLLAAGNKLSEGVSLTGSGRGEPGAVSEYLSTLPNKIRPNWRLPSYLLEKELRCRVRIFLSPNGELARAEIYQSSGDQEYDRRALEAVRSSSPFPKLPEAVRAMAVAGEILLGFPL